MTSNVDRRIRLLFFLAGLPFLYFILTGEEPNWLYYTSLSSIFAGIIYGIVSDWRQGKKAEVKKRLLVYGGLIVLFLIIAFIMNL